METKAKIIPLIDEDGNKLPKNMQTQFRNVQSGIEYLKESADDITVELKGVNKKLAINTTDLGLITKKVTEIEKRQVEHMKITKKSFDRVEKLTQTMLEIVIDVNKRLANLEK